MPRQRGGYRVRDQQRAAQRPDTAADIRGRMIGREAGRLGIEDRLAKFPALTPENLGAALDYQAERIAFHVDRLAAIAAGQLPKGAR